MPTLPLPRSRADEPTPEAPPDAGRSLSGVATAVRVLAVCAAVATLQLAAPVLLPIVLALFLFYALDPLVDRLEGWRIPRLLASIAVVLALVGGAGGIGAAFWPQVEAVVDKVPENAERLRSTLRAMRTAPRDESTLRKVQEAAKAIDTAAAAAAEPPPRTPGVMRVEVQQPTRVSNWLWYGGVGALGLLGQAVTILFLTIFLLHEDDSFKRKLVKHVGTAEKRVTVQILNDIASQIERFLWVQAFTSFVVAVATGLGLWWLGVDQPAVWGLLAGILNVVPYFGPLIVSALLAAVGFLQFGTFSGAASVAGFALLVTTIEGFVLTPHLLSRTASLNPVAIFLSIAFWSWAWGIPGMLLAVPMLMAIKAVCDHVDGLQPVSEFLG